MTDLSPQAPVGRVHLSFGMCDLSFRRAESEAMNPPMSQAFTCDHAPRLSVVPRDP
jgi:hypothetical protein